MINGPECCLSERTLNIRKKFVERLAGIQLLMFIQILPIDRKIFFQNISEKLNVTYETVEMYTKRKLPKKYLEDEFEVFIYAIMYSLKKYSDTLDGQKKQDFMNIWRDKRDCLLEPLENYKKLYSTYNSELKDAQNKNNISYQRQIVVCDFLTGHYPECIGKQSLDIEDINMLMLAFWTVFPDWRKKILVETKKEKLCFPLFTKADNANEIDLDFTYNFFDF